MALVACAFWTSSLWKCNVVLRHHIVITAVELHMLANTMHLSFGQQSVVEPQVLCLQCGETSTVKRLQLSISI